MHYVPPMPRRLLTFMLVAAVTALLSTYWLFEGDLGAAFGVPAEDPAPAP